MCSKSWDNLRQAAGKYTPVPLPFILDRKKSRNNEGTEKWFKFQLYDPLELGVDLVDKKKDNDLQGRCVPKTHVEIKYTQKVTSQMVCVCTYVYCIYIYILPQNIETFDHFLSSTWGYKWYLSCQWWYIHGPKNPMEVSPKSVILLSSWKLSRRCSKMVKVRSPKRCTDSCHLERTDFLTVDSGRICCFEIEDIKTWRLLDLEKKHICWEKNEKSSSGILM